MIFLFLQMGKGPSAFSCFHICHHPCVSRTIIQLPLKKISTLGQTSVTRARIKLWCLVLNTTVGYPSLHAGYASEMFSRVSSAAIWRQIPRQCLDQMFGNFSG